MIFDTSVSTIIFELVRSLRYAEATLRVARSESERQRWARMVQKYREALKAQSRLESGN
jgi:F0F1-type ATP synthase delta subunit